ncbi:MAG: hypothetical protein M1818_002005 [Claussenomyces sp. TS43310]|nr:MAG: hypothetical protein M1818_002005 [Claussenomyces sp. TS43310]
MIINASCSVWVEDRSPYYQLLKICLGGGARDVPPEHNPDLDQDSSVDSATFVAAQEESPDSQQSEEIEQERRPAALDGAPQRAHAGRNDLWDPLERVYAFPVFANASFMGPLFGPVAGGFLGQYATTWRWTEWATLIGSGAILVLIVLFQPETFIPVLLSWKSAHLRRVTGDSRYVSEIEIRADPFFKRLLNALYRPFLLLIREPIVLVFALYLTVIYVILFTFLDGYTFIFGETYGFSEGITGLAFLGIAVGLCGASLLTPLIYHLVKQDVRKIQESGGTHLPPEQYRSVYFGWVGPPTAASRIGHSLVSTVFFGYGIICVFISSYQYIIDSYEMYAASALASLTSIRYVASGAMVVAGNPFYKNLGVHWTLTILGAISTLMVPVPYALYKFGPKIRGLSHYAISKS